MADLIDRERVMRDIIDTYEYEYPTATGAFDEFVTKILPNIINNQPAVNPVKHGHWAKQNNPCYSPFDGSDQYWYYCSRCGEPSNAPYDYCPQCGTRCDE